jgi:hypothetical protein
MGQAPPRGLRATVATREPIVHYYMGFSLLHQSARDITEFCSVNMDAWYYRISVACDTIK